MNHVLVVLVKNISIVMENNLSQYFDHTLLGFNTSLEDVKSLCKEALKYAFKAVCIPPYFVNDAKLLLQESDVKVCTVVGFPLGYIDTLSKSLEAKLAIEQGAEEIDMVINIAALKSADLAFVEQDILSVYSICKDYDVLLKVIIEASELSEDEIKAVCGLCNRVKVDFVKTSTGINSKAKLDDVVLMREVLDDNIQIKASGGIRSKLQVLDFINAGASRIGTSSSVQIVKE